MRLKLLDALGKRMDHILCTYGWIIDKLVESFWVECLVYKSNNILVVLTIVPDWFCWLVPEYLNGELIEVVTCQAVSAYWAFVSPFMFNESLSELSH